MECAYLFDDDGTQVCVCVCGVCECGCAVCLCVLAEFKFGGGTSQHVTSS